MASTAHRFRQQKARYVTDAHLGLKTLYSPPEGTPIKYEIVAVHGIGAHPDKTWCKVLERGGKEVRINWLADKEMLPAALPNARIMRFGAKTEWFGDHPVRTNTSNVAELLLIALRRSRKNTGSRTLPLIFVAHCFGGLAVMKALLFAANTPEDRYIFDSVAGIAFLGTPFRGAEQKAQKKLIKEVCMSNPTVYLEILQITKPNDEMLKDTVRGFLAKRAESSIKARLACFYELEPCDIMAIVGKERTPMTIRVDEQSGCLDVGRRIPMQRNHYNMNKFGGPDEETYKTLEEEIVAMATASTQATQHGGLAAVLSNNLLWNKAPVIAINRSHDAVDFGGCYHLGFWESATPVTIDYEAHIHVQGKLAPLGRHPHVMPLSGRGDNVSKTYAPPRPPDTTPQEPLARPYDNGDRSDARLRSLDKSEDLAIRPKRLLQLTGKQEGNGEINPPVRRSPRLAAKRLRQSGHAGTDQSGNVEQLGSSRKPRVL